MPGLKCSVIGLGKLGSPLAAVLAQKYDTIGVDLNASFVEAINRRIAPIAEPGLQELLSETPISRLTATQDYNEAILKTDITFIIVPTPSLPDGTFSNEYVLEAIAKIGAVLKQKSTYHVVNITSTVMPGSTGGIIKQRLEETSGKRVGIDIGLTYNPEFIALGNVIRGLREPDMVLIGEPHANSREGNLLKDLYRAVVSSRTSFAVYPYVDAELTKLAINGYLSLKANYANMLAQLCEVTPGANAHNVTKAAGEDRRIGSLFFSPGLPTSGPCLPRDLQAISREARTRGVRTTLVDATIAANAEHADWVLKKVKDCVVSKSTRIVILGLSYKPGTDVTDGSTGIALARALAAEADVTVFDPRVSQARELDGLKISYAASLKDAVQAKDILIITTPDPLFKQVISLSKELADFPATIIDCWKILPDVSCQAKVIRLGEYDNTETSSKRLRHVPTPT